MNKSVSRFLVVVAALAAVLGVFSIADAQSEYPADNPVTRGSTFEPDPATANSGAFGFASINPVATAGATGGTGGGDSTGGLAITGSETDLPLAISISLLALGGTAVVASRKRDDE